MQRRATAEGVDPTAVESAVDSATPRASLIALILAVHSLTTPVTAVAATVAEGTPPVPVSSRWRANDSPELTTAQGQSQAHNETAERPFSSQLLEPAAAVVTGLREVRFRCV